MTVAVGIRRRDSLGRPWTVELYNDRLFASFNLAPATSETGNQHFAGSATSIRLWGMELLNNFHVEVTNWHDHDPEKLAVQIDEVQLAEIGVKYQPVAIGDKPFELASYSSGESKAAITIRTGALTFEPCNVPSMAPRFCRLCRTITLFNNADYLIEDVRLELVRDSSGVTADGDAPEFSARCCLCADFSLEPLLYRRGPNCFSVGSCKVPPHPGYGFGSDSIVSDPAHRYELTKADRTQPESWSGNRHCWTWYLGPAKSMRCMHLFMREGAPHFPPDDPCCFYSRTGHAFSDLINHPPRAGV